MRKAIIILLLILTAIGCSKDKIEKQVEYNYDNALYKVYSPYKAGVNNNYNIDKIINKLDMEEVELGLMRLSAKYFVASKHYYQAGQYLTKDKISDLLSNDNLNLNEENKYLKYISYIHEQNYLNKNGELRGISLAIVLNPYQTYIIDEGKAVIETIDEEELIAFGKEKAKELYKYIKDKLKLDKVEVLTTLYLQNSTTSLVPGSYKYESLSNKIKFNELEVLNEAHHLLTSDYVRENDIKTYEAFNSLKETINADRISLSTSGKGFYKDKQLLDIKIEVNINYASLGETNGLAQVIAYRLEELFSNNYNIQVLVKDYSEAKVIIYKPKDENISKIFLIN